MYILHVQKKWAALSYKNINRFVQVNSSVQRKRSNGNLVFIFFMCVIDMNKFFEKHLLVSKAFFNNGNIFELKCYCSHVACE